MEEEGRAEYSVYWWDIEGGQHSEMRFVEAEVAVKRAHTLCRGPAASLGFIVRVIITDGGDCCVFEWKKDEGVVWPKREEDKV